MDRPPSWQMNLEFQLENRSDWRIAWYDEDKARVLMEDSCGGKGSGTSFDKNDEWSVKETGSLRIDLRQWLPEAGARWLSVKGEIPFVVFRHEAVSDPVTVKLLKGFAVPVLLTGAGLTGEDGKPADVKATVQVSECREDMGEDGEKRLELSLVTDRPVGFQGVELQTLDGLPVSTAFRGRGNARKGGEYCWVQIWQIPSVPEGSIRVMVRYARNPQLVEAVVDARAALSGLDKRAPDCRVKTGGAGGGELPVAPPVPGKPFVRAELESLGIKSFIRWFRNVRHESPLQLVFQLRLETARPYGFRKQRESGTQKLDVTDSTGLVLPSAEFDLRWPRQQEAGDVCYAVVEGKSPALCAPGAEWVHLKGRLRVPVDQVRRSPVYELPLAKGAELHIPVPGLDMGGDDGNDVATLGDAVTCRLWFSSMDRLADHQVRLEVNLAVDKASFDWDGFELVDGKGDVLPVESGGFGRAIRGMGSTWSSFLTFRNAENMENVRIRIKYKTDAEIVTVPVDVKVGLGGPLPQKAGCVAKDGRKRQ